LFVGIWREFHKAGAKFDSPANPSCLGLRWQAERDTAFARAPRFIISPFLSPRESAVAAGALPAHFHKAGARRSALKAHAGCAL
jgi:hypothetical protein